MSKENTEIISESTYTDKQGFEIREGLDQDGNRVLLKDAFSEVTETMRYVFIPKSVKIIPAYTFGYFRGKSKWYSGGKEVHELHILCEADSRPEGFYVEVTKNTFQEDYEVYTEYRYKTWCGHDIFTESSRDNFESGPIVLYGSDLPHVHWGVSAQESLKHCEN